MREFLNKLFAESSGVSMLRVMSFLVCITACYISITKRADELGVISVLLSTAFGGKVLQKGLELNASKSLPNTQPQTKESSDNAQIS